MVPGPYRNTMVVQQLGHVVGMGLRQREAHHAGSSSGRRPKYHQAVDRLKSFVRTAGQLMLVTLDRVETDQR